MSKAPISKNRASMLLDLGGGIEITLGEAAKILNTTSRTTLYRWFKHGIDNEPARQLLILHAGKRIIPTTRAWRGYYIKVEEGLVTPTGEILKPRQIEQLRWFISAWHDNMHVVQEISDNIKEIKDSTNERVDFYKAKYNRLSSIYRKRTASLGLRLQAAKMRVDLLERFITLKQPTEDIAKKTPKLTVVKPSK